MIFSRSGRMHMARRKKQEIDPCYEDEVFFTFSGHESEKDPLEIDVKQEEDLLSHENQYMLVPVGGINPSSVTPELNTHSVLPNPATGPTYYLIPAPTSNGLTNTCTNGINTATGSVGINGGFGATGFINNSSNGSSISGFVNTKGITSTKFVNVNDCNSVSNITTHFLDSNENTYMNSDRISPSTGFINTNEILSTVNQINSDNSSSSNDELYHFKLVKVNKNCPAKRHNNKNKNILKTKINHSSATATRKFRSKKNNGLKTCKNISIKINNAKPKEIHKCQVCPEEFSSFYYLQQHIAISHKELKCCVCNTRVTNLYSLKLHYESHTGEIFICKDCNMSFSKISDYEIHLLNHLSGVPFTCNVCYRSFPAECELQLHIVTHDYKTSYRCNVCKKYFDQPKDLKVHSNVHGFGKLHQCLVCYKIFQTPRVLKDHLHTHSDRRPFKCEVCHKSFALSQYLRIHKESKHSGRMPFSCSICKKEFSHSRFLCSHMRIKK